MNRIIKTRLKGFTLIEIIIAMILSGILLSLAIKVIITILSVSTLQNKTASQNNTLLSVYTVLKESFLRASSIEKSGDDDLIFNYPFEKSTSISFQPSIIIVSNYLSQDTIKIPWGNLQIIKIDSIKPLVSKISFIVHYNNSDYPFQIIKEYPNQVLYKAE
jgi:prepilin-type N-terminal cleavage/methylation domain-containing protein